jgi:hypothetical protein
MKHYKINWKKGLDITPEIFIASDNYHIAERNLLGRFLASRLYGIVPDGNFFIEKEIDNNHIYIHNLKCTAITKDGSVIDIQQDTNFQKELTLKDTASAELYVVLTMNVETKEALGVGTRLCLVPDEQALHIYPEYHIQLNETNETIEQGIPILKIHKNSSCWEVDENYIPPSIALNSVDTLIYKYTEIKDIIHEIINKLLEENPFYLQTMMLQLELNNYSLHESPQEFVLLLKKFCLIFQLYLKTAKNIEELPAITNFMEKPYNHFETGNLLQAGLEALSAINQKIDAKPIIEEEPITEVEIKI